MFIARWSLVRVRAVSLFSESVEWNAEAQKWPHAWLKARPSFLTQTCPLLTKSEVSFIHTLSYENLDPNLSKFLVRKAKILKCSACTKCLVKFFGCSNVVLDWGVWGTFELGLRYVKGAFVHFVLSFVLRVPFLPCNVLLMACSKHFRARGLVKLNVPLSLKVLPLLILLTARPSPGSYDHVKWRSRLEESPGQFTLSKWAEEAWRRARIHSPTTNRQTWEVTTHLKSPRTTAAQLPLSC